MSTGGGGFQLIPTRFIDPNISIDYDAVREITDILSTYPEPRQDWDTFVLHFKNDTVSMIWYERDPTPKIYIKHFSSPDDRTFNMLLNVTAPPNKFNGLKRKNVEMIWKLLELLEIDGWNYDRKLKPNPNIHYIYDFPPPEERQKLLDLLKKVYSFPLTKACK